MAAPIVEHVRMLSLERFEVALNRLPLTRAGDTGH